MQRRRNLSGLLGTVAYAIVLCAPALTGQTGVTARAASPQAQSTVGSEVSYQGSTVGEVLLPNVLEPSDKQEFLQLVKQLVGKPLDRGLVRSSIQALYATGRFADIRAEAERAANGTVSLSFITEPNYFVGPMSAEGTEGHPTNVQVVNAGKLQLGELLTQEKLDRALKNMNQLMEQNGYFQAAITYDEVKDPRKQQVELKFHVSPGHQAHVGGVSFTGDSGYTPFQLREIAKLQPGDEVSSQRVTRALERLRKKFQKQNHWLAQARIVSQPFVAQSNTVAYTFDISSGPTVKIEQEGTKISRGQFRKLIPVFQENALDDDLLNEGRRNLLNYLQTRGYFEAKVDYRKGRPNAKNELIVLYHIDQGERHKLVKVEVTGNQFFPADILLQRMQVQPAGRLLSVGRYSQSLLSNDVRTLENALYRYNGFQQVEITAETLDDYQGAHNEIAVILHVKEGPQSLVKDLTIQGTQSVSPDRFELNIAQGQPYSDTKVAEDREIILNYYFNNGFPNATLEATARPDPADANKIDVSYMVHEGERVSVDQVWVTGLEFTRPSVVQKEIQLAPGDALSQIRMLRTQQRLYDLGIFNQVDTAVQNPDGAEKEKNVLINIQEARRYTFNYGLGFEFQTGQPGSGTQTAQGETGVSPRVSFGVTRLNFRGRNHTLSFKTNFGRLQQRAIAGYEAPRWFDSPDWKLSFTLFYDRTIDVTTFTSERLEGAIRAIENISRASTMEYRLTYRRVQATSLPTNFNDVPLLSRPVRVGIPGFTFIRDKRDDPLLPTFGNYTTIDGGVANRYFGSQTDFSRILIQNSTYHIVGKQKKPDRAIVFARSTRIGIETPFSNTAYVRPGEILPAGIQPIPLPELFLAGGGNSHRGFGLNQAGPRDPRTGFPIGGAALFLNNLELRFPPVLLPFVQDNLSFAIFHDAGNVFSTGHDMLHSLLRWSQKNPNSCSQDGNPSQCDYNYISHAIGVGVRYRTPIGPVRFDFGYNLNPPFFPSCQADPQNSAPTTANCPNQSAPLFVPQRARRFNVFFSIGQTF